MSQKRIKKFNELMDPELGMELGLHTHLVDPKDEDYFFDSKVVNKIYDEGVIKVFVYDIRSDGQELVFRTKIQIHKLSFDIYIITDFNNDVEFGTSKGKHYMHSFEKILKPELEYFIDMFEDIYVDLIPHNYWEVKGKNN